MMASGMSIYEEQPLAYVVESALLSSTCTFCLKTNQATMDCRPSVLRCRACKTVHYCDAKCQKCGWAEHKLECASLVNVNETQTSQRRVVPSSMLRLMGRLVRTKPIVDGTCPTEPRLLNDLATHEHQFKDQMEHQEHFAVLKQQLGEFLPAASMPEAQALFSLYCAILVNSYRIVDEDLNAVATGLYLQLSQLDHSCAPNAAVVFNGRTAQLRALQPNTEHSNAHSSTLDPTKWTISYVDLLQTSEERKEQLNEQYYFECSCPRCADKTDDQSMTAVACPSCVSGRVALQNQTTGQFTPTNQCCKCECTISSDQAQTALSIMQQTKMHLIKWEQQALKQLDSNGLYVEYSTAAEHSVTVLGTDNVYCARLCQLMMHVAIRALRFTDALVWALRFMPAFRLYYPDNYPNVIVQMLSTAKLLLYEEHINDAQQLLSQCERMLPVMFDEDHPVRQRFMQLKLECKPDKLPNALTN